MYSVPDSGRPRSNFHVRRTSLIEADVDHYVPLFPTCGRHVRCTQIGESSKDHQCGKEVSTWLPSWQSCSLSVSFSFWPGHSVFSFQFLFRFRGNISWSSSATILNSLATAVGLLCDDHWTECVHGRHIISSRAMSEDNQRCQWRR